jgi:AcrR family transcriptional regulator
MTGIAHPARTRAPTDDRRAAIALAARALIVEKGVEGLRTRDIAERVGINVATLHYHVPSKEALIELVADSLRADFIQQTIDRPRSHLSAKQRMDLEFVDFRELVEERPEVLLVFSELMERARRDDRIAEAIRPLRRKWRQIVADILSEGVSDGVYRRDIDPDFAATMIIGSIIGFCRTGMGDLDGLDRLVAELQRAIRNPALDAPGVQANADLSKSVGTLRHLGGPVSKE